MIELIKEEPPYTLKRSFFNKLDSSTRVTSPKRIERALILDATTSPVDISTSIF